MAGLRQARGAHVITMDDDLQNPPGEVLRLLAPRAGERQGRGLHLLCARSSMRRWRNLGSRFTNRVADWLLDKPKGLYLSSFRCMSAFVAKAITDYDGPFPYVDGLIMQVTQSIGQLEVEHLPRAHRAQQLHAAPAGAAVAQHVREFLGDAAAALDARGLRAEPARASSASPGWWARRCCTQTPPGWASLTAAVLLLSGVQLLILGLIGEYLGRLYLTMNRKPQAVVRDVVRSDAAERAAPRPQLQPAPEPVIAMR